MPTRDVCSYAWMILSARVCPVPLARQSLGAFLLLALSSGCGNSDTHEPRGCAGQVGSEDPSSISDTGGAGANPSNAATAGESVSGGAESSPGDRSTGGGGAESSPGDRSGGGGGVDSFGAGAGRPAGGADRSTGGADSSAGGVGNSSGGAGHSTGGLSGAGPDEPGGQGGAPSPSDESAGAAGASEHPLALEEEPCAGYTLLCFLETVGSGVAHKARLIDMAGNLTHEWPIAGFPPKMLPGGALIGGVGAVSMYDVIEMRQVGWFNAVQWSFSNWVDIGDGQMAARQHHDFQREGNPVGYYAPGQDFVPQGKTLVLAHEIRTVPEIREQPLLDDVIYEVDWEGTLTGSPWYAADHIDEFGFDQEALDDIRTHETDAEALEWLHGNSISWLGHNHWFDEGWVEFDPDNIIYSSRDASLVVIISADTGEVVWRVGPDFAGRPEEKLGQFAGQHHAHMIPKGLPGAGNILVFDNGGDSGYGGESSTGFPNRYSRAYSRVLEFDPVSFDIVWEYGSASGEQNYYSQLISSAQRLPNGNTLITVGSKRHLMEVTPSKEIVWEYTFMPNSTQSRDSVYRAYRVAPEWLPGQQNALNGNYATWASLFEG